MLRSSSPGEDHIEVITRVSDPLRHPDTDIIGCLKVHSVPGVTGLGAVILGDVGLDVQHRGVVQDVHPGQVHGVPLNPLHPSQGQAYVGRAVGRPDIITSGLTLCLPRQNYQSRLPIFPF